MTVHPFQLSNLVHLVEYLTDHSTQRRAEFTVKLTLNSDTNYDSDNDLLQGITSFTPPVIDDVESISMRCKVVGATGLVALYQETPYTIEKISWKGEGGNSIRIDCLTREVYLYTESVSFAELCRHKLTGEHVRKFIVDLRIH
jgi:hypothetical protein